MIRINLLPYESRHQKSIGFTLDKVKVIPLSVLSVVLVACFSALTIQNARLRGIEQEVASARAETEQYKKTIALINEMVAKEQELNRRLNLVQSLDKNRFATVAVMDEMAQRVPRYLWLTSLKNVAPERVAIGSRCAAVGIPSPSRIVAARASAV